MFEVELARQNALVSMGGLTCVTKEVRLLRLRPVGWYS